MYNEIIKRSKSSQIETGVQFGTGHSDRVSSREMGFNYVNLKL